MPYEVSTDKSRLDIDLIHKCLSTEAYWSKKIPRALVTRDAHELYRKFGFDELADAARHMEILVRNPYAE